MSQIIDTTFLNSTCSDNSFDRDIGIITAVLESGNSVEMTATGYSMFPALRPGDRIIVTPLIKGDLPQPGSVVVYGDNNALVIHRLIEIQNKSGEYTLTTRGDSREENDRSLTQQQLLGVAVSYKRNQIQHSLKSIIPGIGFHIFNRVVLWIYFRFKKMLP